MSSPEKELRSELPIEHDIIGSNGATKIVEGEQETISRAY